MNLKALEQKANVLTNMIISVGEIYHASDNENDRNQIETLLGAGIFYLTTSKQLCSGLISINALELLRQDNNAKLVKEHSFPRKLAANEILNKKLEQIKEDPNLLRDLYINRYGRYNLVTQIENGQLRAYQKLGVFESEIDSYQKAGVELVNLNEIENQFLFDEVPSLKRFFNRPEYLLN
jgi:hypothetical protein